MLSEFKPNLIVTMGWTSEHILKKQNWIRKHVKPSGIPHIYWATEDPTHTESFTLPFIQTVQPDFIFTICTSRVKYYRHLAFKSAHMDFGYEPKVHYNTKSNYLNPISTAVVANAYPHVLKLYPEHYRYQSLKMLICPLLNKKIRIDFWGRDWNKMKSTLGYDIPSQWIHGYIPYLEANKIYSSADIVIGLQNHTTQLTQRTYEILGSGGFLLTCDTPEIRRLFKPGQDLVVSSCPEETLKLIEYYLNNPEERKRIIRNGKIAVEKHSYKHRAEYMIEILKKHNILSEKLDN
jgi:spore maturation protein CgeB